MTLYSELLSGARSPFDQLLADTLRPAPAAKAPPLTPQEEDSLLRKLGGSVMGAANYLGSSLDKLGRPVRAAISELQGNDVDGSEYLAWLPFSDTLGLTDSANTVSGRDLVSGMGRNVAGPMDDLLGFGAEVLLDPATYLTLGAGALGKAGKVASKLGKLPDTHLGRVGSTLADVVHIPTASRQLGQDVSAWADDALGGVARLGIPFTDLGVNLGGEKLARRLDAAGEALKYSRPGRLAARIFDPAVQGAATAEGQRASRQAYAAGNEGVWQARGKAAAFKDQARDADVLEDAAGIRQAIEAVDDAPEAARDVGNSIAREYQNLLAREQDMGLGTTGLDDDVARYGARYHTTLTKPTKGYDRRKPLGARHNSMESRQDILRNIEGGTEGINAMIKDVMANPADAPDRIRRDWLGLSDDDLADASALHASLDTIEDADELAAAQAELAGIDATIKQSEKLADWIGKLDPQYASQSYFGNHPLTDFIKRASMAESRLANADAIYDLFARTSSLTDDVADGVPLSTALKEAGLTGKQAPNKFRSKLPADIQEQLAEQMDELGGDLGDDLGDELGEAASNPLDDILIPRDIVDDATRVVKGLTLGDSEPVKLFDKLTALFKTGVTTLWPAFHGRNAATAVWQNYLTGGGDFGGYKDAWDLLHGRAAKGATKIPALKGMTPQDATRQLQNMAMQYRVADVTSVGDFANLADDVAGRQAADQQLYDLLGQFPGERPDSLRQAVFSGFPRSKAQWNPLNQAGVGANRDVFAPVAAGRRVGNMTESMGRLAGFINLLKKGYDPAVAAGKIRAAHVDYRALTDVEREAFRRVIPFYTFTRAMIPWTLRELAQRPGGKVANAISFTNAQRDEKGFVPEYIGSSLAIPVGSDNQTTRYLTGLGMPHEIINQLATLGPGGLQQTGMDLLGQLNPLIKTPLELMTGKQFYSGRDLKDLDPRTGRIAQELGLIDDAKSVPYWLDEVVMNSPLSRAVSTVGQAVDPRKDWGSLGANLATGMRLTDVDTAQQRERMARNIIDDMLQGAPGVGKFETYFVSPENRSTIDPETLRLLQMLESIKRQSRARQKAAA